MLPKFQRKSNRLPHRPLYEGNYWYFVTISTQNKIAAFVEAGLSRHGLNDEFKLNQYGKEVKKSWLALKDLFDGICLDEYVIMPNHFHGIIGFAKEVIQKNTGNIVDLGDVVSRFKNCSRKGIIKIYKDTNTGETGSPLRIDGFNPYKFWQKSFYDHIVRDHNDLRRVREYIENNPTNWKNDKLNPKNLTSPTLDSL